MIEERVSSFIDLFKNMPDDRQSWKVKHLLHEIIFIVIAGTLVGLDDFEDIEYYANHKKNWFSQYLALPNGIPSHDTMERAFQVLDTNSFLQRFLEFTKLAAAQTGQGVIAIDGKTMRGTKDGLLRPAHIVSAWFSETGMVLGQMKTEEKSNEITLIPHVLDMLAVKGHVVTIDAMGTQKDIAKKITEKHGDYVLAVKKNQPNLFQDIQDYFNNEVIQHAKKDAEKQTSNPVVHYCHQIQKGHGRAERREYYITEDIEWMNEAKKDWAQLKSIGMVRYSHEANSIKDTEVRYFITTLDASAEKFAYCVRNHWGIESMHWTLDTVFNEDKRRFRKQDAAENLSQVIKFAYNILAKDATYKGKKITKKRLMMLLLMDETLLEKRIAAVFS